MSRKVLGLGQDWSFRKGDGTTQRFLYNCEFLPSKIIRWSPPWPLCGTRVQKLYKGGDPSVGRRLENYQLSSVFAAASTIHLHISSLKFACSFISDHVKCSGAKHGAITDSTRLAPLSVPPGWVSGVISRFLSSAKARLARRNNGAVPAKPTES